MQRSLQEQMVERESNKASSADEVASLDSLFIQDEDIENDDEEIKEEVVPLHVI